MSRGVSISKKWLVSLFDLKLFDSCYRRETAVERAVEMSGRADGGSSRFNRRAAGLFSKKGRGRAWLQQVARKNGKKYTIETQGTKTKVSCTSYNRYICILYFLIMYIIYFSGPSAVIYYYSEKSELTFSVN